MKNLCGLISFVLLQFVCQSEVAEERQKRQISFGNQSGRPQGGSGIQFFQITTPQTFVIGNDGRFVPGGQPSIGFPGQSGSTPNCRGNRRRRPECQGQGNGGNRRPVNCNRRRNRQRPECQGQTEGTEAVDCQRRRNRNRPECQNAGNTGGVPDEAIKDAFDQIPWLQTLTNRELISLPGLPKAPTSNSQTRFYQLAFGARDVAFQECITPRFERGHCRFLQHCILPDFVQSFTVFLRYVCIIEGVYVGVCCPDSRYPTTPHITPPPVTPRPTPRPTTPPSASGCQLEPGNHAAAGIWRIVCPPDLNTTGQCGISNQQQTKIVGGKNTEPNKFPWTVALLLNGATQYCGGVLITFQHVLTAAHCVNERDRSTVTARIGEYTFGRTDDTFHQDLPVAQIKMHGRYDTSTQENDIAILTLSGVVEGNKQIWPICLPPPGDLYVGQMATVVGWGTIYHGGPVSRVLQEVTIPVWDNTECDSAYRDNTIFPVNLCAGDRKGGKDSCQGDSGGPLMIQNGRQWTVIGIVSWGLRCAEPEIPGVYARVNTFLDWIHQQTS